MLVYTAYQHAGQSRSECKATTACCTPAARQTQVLLQVKPVAVVPINPDRYSELGLLFTFLEELQHRNAIKLKPKLAPGPPNAQLLEAANLKKSCRYSDNMHVEIEVSNFPLCCFATCQQRSTTCQLPTCIVC